MSVDNGTKIGYALGGGAARGLSHIGVLKVLEEYKISPDIIAGTSMGAVIGALYAGGLKASDIEHLVLQVSWKRLVLPTDIMLPLGGLTQGKRVISLLKSILGDLRFSQLKYDFACVTTDIINGEQVVLRDGSLIDAVRASISIPGIFAPVMIDEKYLVDGGLVNEVPVSVCRVIGAEYVIGVNVLPEPSKIMCNPKKGRHYPACELIRLGENRDKNKLTVVSNLHGYSLRSRLDNIEHNMEAILLDHQPKKQRKTLKSADSLRMGKAKRLQVKVPSLIDVLTQSLIIAEYRVAMDNLKDADIVISPQVEDIGFWQFTKAAQAIAAGEKAARYVLQQSKLASVLSQS
jgi:NTE family protein